MKMRKGNRAASCGFVWVASIFAAFGAIGADCACERSRAHRPVTRGEAVALPDFTQTPYTLAPDASAIAIPNQGWYVGYPRQDKPPTGKERPGITIIATNATVRGANVPALRLELVRGEEIGPSSPCILLDFPVDFEEYNIWSFAAKIEVPEGCDRLIYDSKPTTGRWAQIMSESFDDFGIGAVDTDQLAWIGLDSFATDFKNHHYPEKRSPEGFDEFRWDVRDEERAAYKGFVHDRVKQLAFYYDTRKIPAGKKVTITIADMKLVKGAGIKVDEPEMYGQWLDWVRNYRPDYSDSSHFLEPPKEGRLGLFDRLWLVKDGVAQGEIVVDMSDGCLLENYYSTNDWNYVIRGGRGMEREWQRSTAADFKRWLKEITGADFDCVEQPTAKDNVKIFLGAGFARGLFDDDLRALAEGEGGCDGFAVRVKGRNIYIFGPHPIGTRNGVYRFLENNTDIIWAMQFSRIDADGVVFTPVKDLKVVWGDARSRPAFGSRGWMRVDTEWARANGSNFCLPIADSPMPNAGGHFLSPAYYDLSEGIQRFSGVKNGRRVIPWSESQVQMCLSNRDLLKYSLERVPCLPHIRYAYPFFCNFGADDNMYPCECENCRKPIKLKDGTMLDPKRDLDRFYSAWYYTYINQIDAAIRKQWPEFQTSTFAYLFGRRKPPIDVSPNIAPVLCSYYRKAYNQPIFAPANQQWWATYKEWAAHTKYLQQYDYYGLCFNDQPMAEVLKFDYLAQLKIGFRSGATEGAGSLEYIGVADERWCISRLQWDPTLDVEQLHRYFNRRTYREAAPWIDRFRGTIRTHYYQCYKTQQHLSDCREVASVIRSCGIEQELRGYIAKALEVVKNEKSRRLIEKMQMDFDYIMKPDWDMVFRGDWPSNKVKKAPLKRVETTANPCEAVFEAGTRAALAAAKRGDWAAATNCVAQAFAGNRLVPAARRARALIDICGEIAYSVKDVKAKDVMALFRRWDEDDFCRANGWSVRMNGWDGIAIVRDIASRFERKGDFDNMVAVYDIWADWDGSQLPVSLRTNRVRAKMKRLHDARDAARKRYDAAKARYDQNPQNPRAMRDFGETMAVLGRILTAEQQSRGGYLYQLRRSAAAGATAEDRGNAKLDLYREERSQLARDQRLKRLFELIDDPFMHNTVRTGAAREIVDACSGQDGKIDWNAAADNMLKALAAGDWSNLQRSVYTRQNSRDNQLDVLIETAERAAKEGAVEIAKRLLGAGAKTLKYTKDATLQSVDGGHGRPQGLEERLKKLDAALAKFGLARE